MLPESGWYLSPYFPHCPQLIPETYSFQPLKFSEVHPSSLPFMLGLHLGHLHALTSPARTPPGWCPSSQHWPFPSNPSFSELTALSPDSTSSLTQGTKPKPPWLALKAPHYLKHEWWLHCSLFPMWPWVYYLTSLGIDSSHHQIRKEDQLCQVPGRLIMLWWGAEHIFIITIKWLY